jgi:hypothetical protein
VNDTIVFAIKFAEYLAENHYTLKSINTNKASTWHNEEGEKSINELINEFNNNQ